MTDILDQEGISFLSSGMASTSPSVTPAAITAPKIDMENAPANQTIPAVPASGLEAPLPKGGKVAPPPSPQDIAVSNTVGRQGAPEGSAAAGAAPPQPLADNSPDILDKEGISVDSAASAPSPFGHAVSLSPGQQQSPEADAVKSYADQQQAQLAALGTKRFTPQQMASFANNPVTMAEAIQSQNDWPDVPALLDKTKAGVQLTDTQKSRLNDYIDTTLSMNLRGMSWGGNTAVTAQQLSKAAQDYINSGDGGQGSTETSAAPSNPAGPNAVVPNPYTPKPGETALNDFAAVTDKGKQIMAQADEKPASTALKITSMQDLPANLKSALYDAYLVHDPNARLSDMQTQQGFHKAIDAIGEQKAVSVMDMFFKELSGMTFEEHKAATWSGGVLPISTDIAGTPHLDFRAGITAPLAQPGDVMQGNITEGELPETARDFAINMAMIDFGEAGGRMMDAKAARNVPAANVDDYLNAVAPAKDDAMVKAGVVSVDGAKSNSTVDSEAILKSKGIPPAQAQEVAENMTATEKDNFVARNTQPTASSTPTLEEAVPQRSIPDHIKPQLLPDEPPPSGETESDLIKSQNAAVNADKPPTVPEKQSGFNALFKGFKEDVWPQLYAEAFNDVQPIEDLTKKARAAGATVPEGQDTALTVSLAKSLPAWIERNWTTNTTTWDDAGNQTITGKGLKVIRDDFDNHFMKTEPDWQTRHADLDAYKTARTFLEDKEKKLSDVSPRDYERSVADMARLSQKYGDDFSLMGNFAKQEIQWGNRVLHQLVDGGLKTQEWYDATIGEREWYSPTARVVEEEFPESLSAKSIGKDVTPSRIGALKGRKGSSLDVKNVFQSMLKNSAIIMQRSRINKLRVDIAKYEQYYPEDVKVSKPALIREAVEHSYDPKLRGKLEELVKFLGGEVKRVTKAKIDDKPVLGAYSSGPEGKSVLLSRGTTEGTLTHEAGHMLDDVLDLKSRLLGNAKMKGELQKLAEDRLNAEVKLQRNARGMTEFAEKVGRAPKSYMNYLKNDDEVIANFFDAWVNSPEQVERTAPAAKAVFEKLIDENPQLAALREIEPSTARAMETIEKPLLDMRGPKGSVPVYIDGARNYLELSKPLEKAFKEMNPMEIGMVGRFFDAIVGSSKKLLQAGATSLPEFMLKHFYRAVFTSFLNKPGKVGILDFLQHAAVDMPRAVFAVIKKNELYKEWASSSGALRTYMDLSDPALAKMQKSMFQEGNMGSYLNPLHWYKIAKEVSDYAPRIAVYRSMKADGASDLTAGLASLEATGNYIRHGSVAKRINRFAPFFNDMVQGGDRFVRSQMRNKAAFTVRAVSTVLLPQLMLTGYYLYGADDQTRHEYLNIPEFDRNMAMCIKIGDTWKKLPRPFAPGFVYGALTEQAMIYAYSKSHDDVPQIRDFWLKTLSAAATSVSPVFDWTRAITPLFKSWMEATTNYSLFMQRPLFTGDMQKTMPADQSNQYTTETAKMIGKLFNISPINVDNTIYDMAGKAGRFAEQLSDMAINGARKATGQPVNERDMRPADSPLYGGLVMDTPRGTNTESYQEFLGNLHEAQQTNNHLKELTGQDKGDFQNQNARTLGAYESINEQSTRVNDLQKDIRNINRNTNLSGSAKTEQVNQKQDEIGRIVEGANKAYRAATQGGTK